MTQGSPPLSPSLRLRLRRDSPCPLDFAASLSAEPMSTEPTDRRTPPADAPQQVGVDDGKGQPRSCLPPTRRLRIALAVFVAAQLALLGACVGVLWISEPPVADEWMWAGGVSSNGFIARVRVAEGSPPGTFVVSLTRDLSEPHWHSSPIAGAGVHSVNVTGLNPDTVYYYGVSADDVGRVRTWPTSGPYRIRFAVASCASTGSSHGVFDEIADGGYDLFIASGDLHYRDITANDTAEFEKAFGYVHGSRAQRRLFRSTPVAYMWDDHDFGPNNADSTSPSRRAALESYTRNVPHAELPSSDSVYHGLTVGRIRFLFPDLRSEMRANGRMMSAEQEAWFEDELSRAGSYSLVVMQLGTPWVGAASGGGDNWLGHAAARERISKKIAAVRRAGGPLGGYANILGLAGDAHMLAYDDGSHTDYSATADAGFPLVQAAPLDRPGSAKGGPYTTPCYGYSAKIMHQYASVTIEDSGGSNPSAVCVSVQLRAHGSVTWESGRRCGPLISLGAGGAGDGACSMEYLPTADQAILFMGLSTFVLMYLCAGMFHCLHGCCPNEPAVCAPAVSCCDWRRASSWLLVVLATACTGTQAGMWARGISQEFPYVDLWIGALFMFVSCLLAIAGTAVMWLHEKLPCFRPAFGNLGYSL
eukprot:TRINITY_DN29678_c0_g1_i1.p1 TRINITY_DN29678_c0_g1~~TRINITY_DN29678_c0_g1_i1.p1  ORF type:complete len:645 (+),score=121.44 TRINITY_DN29678_c0_g1_i1:47-1981(+)